MKKTMFIVYVSMEGKNVPVICTRMNQDPLKKDFVRLSNIRQMSDSHLPELTIDSLAVPVQAIAYYVCGTIEEEDEDEVKEKNDTAESVSGEEDLWNWK